MSQFLLKGDVDPRKADGHRGPDDSYPTVNGSNRYPDSSGRDANGPDRDLDG